MVMRQLRENTKWIMLITVAAFVALMVFEWGMDASGGSAEAMTGGELGKVNGSSIMYAEFSQTYRTMYQQRQQEVGSISPAENRQIEDEAFEQLVMDRLINRELRDRGIRVTNEEIREAALYLPPPEFYQHEAFQTDGEFDLSKYHQFLRSPAADPQLLVDLEHYYRRMIPRSKLFQQISASVVVTDGELWRQYREQHETATARFARLDPRQLVPAGEVTVGDRAIATYYNDNRQHFERPARAEIRVASLSKVPTAADTVATEERAREIRQEIVDGAAFEEVARRESEDGGSAGRGGDLGTVRRNQTVPPFEEAVWAASIGQVTEPVLTDFGFHLIRVDRRTEEEADVSHILVPVERTIESEDALLARVDSLENLAERMSLNAAAEEVGLQVRTTELTPVLPNLPGIGPVDAAVEWVFRDRPGAGEVSPILENDRSYYIVELVEREDSRSLTLEEATPAIRNILIRERQRERTRELGRQVVDRLQAGATLEAAAAEIGVDVGTAGPFTRLDFVPGLGQANAAIGAAFGLDIGETSGLISTPEAFFIVQVTDRTEADRDEWSAQADLQRQQVMSYLQSQRINQYLDGLREEARIVDQRERVLQRGGPAS
jgi:peptidyl-prolyl cis-trans isomerase D